MFAEKLKEALAGSGAAVALNPPDAVVVAAPNKLPGAAAGWLPVKLKADLAGSVAGLALNIELCVVVAGAEAPNVNADPAAGAAVVAGLGWALKVNEGFGASKVAALDTAGAPAAAPKLGAETLDPPKVECRRVCVLLAGACPKEKLAPEPAAGAGADVSAGLAEKENDGAGAVDPVEDAAVEVLVAENEKVVAPEDVVAALDTVACPKENEGPDEELDVVVGPALKLNAGEGPVEPVDDLSELAPPNENREALSDLVVAGSEVGFVAPKVGRGSVSAAEEVISDIFGNPPKENAGATLAGAAAVAEVVVTETPEAKVGKVPDAVDTGSVVLSPKPPKLGTGRVFVVSVFSFSPPVRLNVTVLFLVVAPSVVLDASAVDVGDEMVPIENGVAVVDVTDDNVAVSVVVAALSLSDVVLLLRPKANPPLPES